MYTKLEKLLDKADAVLLTSPYAMRYFSGFSGGEGAVWVSRKQRIIFTDSRYTEQAQAETKSFEVVETNKAIECACQEAEGISAQAVFVEESHLTADLYVKLKQNMPKAELLFGSKELNALRMIKTEAELSFMREAELISCRAFEHILGFIKPEVSEMEISAELEYFMKRNGGEGLAFDTIAISGSRTSLPHGVPGKRKVQPGDFVTMDFGCIKDGYCSDMTRTVVVGKATDEQKSIYNTVLLAQKKGLEAIREGVLANEVDAAARQVIEQAGYGKYFRHSLGHGVGMLVHELPNLSPASDIVLKENMVVTCEPGIYVPDFGGVRIEDMVCVKQQGIENMTPATKELIEL